MKLKNLLNQLLTFSQKNTFLIFKTYSIIIISQIKDIMSRLIEMQASKECEQAQVYRSGRDRQLQNKIKKFLNGYVQELEESGYIKIIKINKTTNAYSAKFTMNPFYNDYSFLCKLIYDEEKGILKLSNIFMKDEQLLTLKTKDMRLAALMYAYQFRRRLPEYVVTVDQNTGTIQISIKLIIVQELGNSLELFHLVLKKLIYQILENADNFLNLIKETTDNEVQRKPYHKQKQVSVDDSRFSLALKYLSMSFVDMSISQSELNKIITDENITERDRICNNKKVNFKQFQMESLFGVYLNYQKYKECKIDLKSVFINDREILELREHLKCPFPRIYNQNENQYIYNEIIIVEDLNNINVVKSNIKGGTAQMQITQLKFEYKIQQNSKRKQKPKYSGVHKPLQKFMLVKKPLNKTSQKYIEREMKILSTLRHAKSPYLIKYYKTQQKCKLENCLLMDYLPNCPTLHHYMEKRKLSLSILGKLSLLSNISNGLRFLKHYHIAHMDFTPSNILVGPHLNTKIIDFGEAYSYLQEIVDLKNYSPGFTNPYGAPQTFTRNQFTSKQDSFSFGIILFKLLLGRLPFEPTQKLKQSYRTKTYNEKLYFAVEHLDYVWLEKPIFLLFSMFVRCKSYEEWIRPYPTWTRLIFRILVEWYRNCFAK